MTRAKRIDLVVLVAMDLSLLFERLSELSHLVATNPRPCALDDERIEYTVNDKDTNTEILVTVARHPSMFEDGKMLSANIQIIECNGYKCRIDGRDGEEHVFHCLSCCNDFDDDCEVPDDIQFLECNGYKCRLDGRYGERQSVHCASCYGDLDINMFIKRELPVSTLLELEILDIASWST